MDEASLARASIQTPGEREFRELADFAPALIWRSGVDGLCDWFNKPWLDFVGRRMEQEIGYGWAEGVHPEDRDRCISIYTTSFDARRPFSMEYRLRRHDGDYRWVLDNGAPFQRGGQFAGYFGSCIDVTAHREQDRRQQQLIRELDHRVKNILTTVQSIAAQSFRNTVDDGASEAFAARLIALARMHDILIAQMWQGAELCEIASCAVSAYESGLGTFEISGPAYRIAPQSALTLAMALHELCTNAVKYGALSVASGRVAISWAKEDDRLVLRWAERDGPTVIPASYEGFGSRFVARQVARELKGTVNLAFPPRGVTCEIALPFSQVMPEPNGTSAI